MLVLFPLASNRPTIIFFREFVRFECTESVYLNPAGKHDEEHPLPRIFAWNTPYFCEKVSPV